MLKKIVFSGIQPSGQLTIGNYIGALSQWVNIQDRFDCIYCIADLHAITTNDYNINLLQKNIFDTLSLYLACGIDANKSTVFVQSHLSEHYKLHWILNCFTNFNELKRMTQFKNKYKYSKKDINCGIFNYPILMAADVLLYQTDFVPVGADQKQHIELVKKIAYKFNNQFCDSTFKIPEPLIIKSGSRIMSLINPNKKMSKSDINKNNVIFLLEDPKFILKKIKQAVTDSDNPPIINYDIKKKAGISNLLNILSVISGKSILSLEKEFYSKMYSQLKQQTAEYLCDLLVDIQKKYYFYRNNKNFLKDIIVYGAQNAKSKAKTTIKKVYKNIGLI